MDIFDTEAEMMRAEAAQARVDDLNALPRAGQYRALMTRCDPEPHRDVVRTLQLHDNRPALRAFWIQLEDECIDLLPPEHRERFRSTP